MSILDWDQRICSIEQILSNYRGSTTGKESVLIHLAAETQVVNSRNEPEHAIKKNIDLGLGALEFCRRTSSRLILASSALSVVIEPNRSPISISNLELKELSPYHLSKYLLEQLALYYAEMYSLKLTILRIFSVYGEGQRENSLLPMLRSQIISDSPVIEVETKEPIRDFIHIDDVTNAIVSAAMKPPNCSTIVDVGTGIGTSIGKLIEMIQKYSKTEKLVVEKGGPRQSDKLVSVAKIRSNQDLDLYHCISLSDGLRKMFSARALQNC
jgi:UDP-glucose 4-epimerase